MTADDGDDLSRVAAEVVVCTKCPLHRSRTKAVPGEGPADAMVMIIGEAPGKNEDLQGRPFVGAAGRKLEGLLQAAGLTREQVFITNIVKCRPPNNRKPAKLEADTCGQYLQRQISLLDPEMILLLGDTALKRFFPDRSLGEAHGKVIEQAPRRFFATYHPAAMLYNQALERVMRDDFRALGEALAKG